MDSSVPLSQEDFISTPGRLPGGRLQMPAQQYARLWVALERLFPQNWANAFCCLRDEEPAHQDSRSAAQYAQQSAALTNRARRALLGGAVPSPSVQGFEDCEGIENVSKTTLNDRAEKCRKAVRDLSESPSALVEDPTSYGLHLPHAKREENFMLVGWRYLLPLAAEDVQMSLSKESIDGILADICVRYNKVPYHNVSHATMVMHHAVEICKYAGVWSLLSPREKTGFVFAAAGHDVGHPGKSSALFVKTAHPLATLYNDRHILENYHAALLLSVLHRHGWRPLERSNKDHAASAEMRAMIVQCVLWTDIQNHARIIGAAGETLDHIKRSGKKDKDLRDLLTRAKAPLRDVLGMVLKAADLSYTALSEPLHVIDWAVSYYVELYSQRQWEEEFRLPLCEVSGPQQLGGGKWFESNYKFCVEVVMPIAHFLISIEKRLCGSTPEAVDAEEIERLTSPDTAIEMLRKSEDANDEWAAIAADLYKHDQAGSKALSATLAPPPISQQTTVSSADQASTAATNAMKWISKQTNVIIAKSKNTSKKQTRLYRALLLPLERNAETLKKARYLAHI